MKKYILFVVASVFFYVNARAQYCTPDNRFTQIPVFTVAQIAYDTAVVYGNALNYQGQNQDLLLNICYPASAADTFSKRPLIVLMHGGGFLTGSRNDLNTMCIEFAKRGFVAVTAGYRLGWNSGSLNCGGDTISNAKAVYRGYQDAHAAIRYLVAHAGTYKIDTAWIFAGGESAGGVNSLNLAFTGQDEMNGRLPFLQPELGNINNSGNNLDDDFSLKGIFNNWGSIVETGFITASDAIPVIAFHGDADQCLPVDSGRYSNCPNYIMMFGSRSICKRLESLGICTELTVKPGGDHGIYDETTASDVFRVGRACCFFKSLFCSNCSPAYLTDSVSPDCEATSINNYENDDEAGIYPNPCTGRFTVCKSIGREALTGLRIFNILGENVFQNNDCGQQATFNVDLMGLAKGVYFVEIKSASRIITQKLIVH